MASDWQPQAAVPRGKRVLPLPAAAFVSFSPKKHRVCLQSWARFQRLKEVPPRICLQVSPKQPGEVTNKKNLAGLTLPWRQGVGWMPSPKSFLAQFALKIWLEFVSREIRGSGELSSG